MRSINTSAIRRKNRILIENDENHVVGYLAKEEYHKISTAKGWNKAIRIFPTSLNKHNTLKRCHVGYAST